MNKVKRFLRGPGLVWAVLLTATTAWSLATISARKVYSAGQVFTAADYNLDVDYWVTYINQLMVKFPGDSVKTLFGSFDTLTTRTAAGVITLKDPLWSLSASDSLKFHLINARRANLDTLGVGATGATGAGVPVGFRVAFTAGIRARANLLSTDSLRIVDSLDVSAGAKVSSRANIKTDSLSVGSAPVVGFRVAFTAGIRARANLISTDSLRIVDSLIFAGGAKVAMLGSTSGLLTLLPAATTTSYTLTLPATGGTADYPITTNGSGTWSAASQLSLTAGVTGVLPVANGGTNASSASITAFNNITGYTASGAMGTTSTKLVFSTSPSITTPAFITSATVTDDDWIGLSSGAGRIEFDDQATDEVNILNARLGINTATPGALLHVDGGSGTVALFDDGLVIIGDGTTTSNAQQTIGLTIDQRGNDDSALSLKSSDVAHGITGGYETDTYGVFGKQEPTSGGLSIIGIKDADGNPYRALILSGWLGEAADVTHTAAGFGIIDVGASIKSGVGTAAVGANGNLFSVGNAGSTAFIVDAEGDLFADGSDVTVYDFEEDGKPRDDVAAISALDRLHARMSDKQLVDSEWEDFQRYNEQDLIDMGILGGPRVNVAPEKRGLVNYTGLVRLHNGAIRQLGREQNSQEYELNEMKNRIVQLEIDRFFSSCQSQKLLFGRD